MLANKWENEDNSNQSEVQWLFRTLGRKLPATIKHGDRQEMGLLLRLKEPKLLGGDPFLSGNISKGSGVVCEHLSSHLVISLLLVHSYEMQWEVLAKPKFKDQILHNDLQI